MSTCGDCRFYKPAKNIDGNLCAYGSCYVNPPVYVDDYFGWTRPKVYPEDMGCRFFQKEDTNKEKK
jgi:hypothetical protein